jgi:peptidoglycan/LPS O-acetylase OafA/YrhL
MTMSPTSGATQKSNGRFAVLDGWRGLSILFVLATHLLPLGPKAWQLNDTSGPLGMSLFFTLSGFLITHFLQNRPDVVDFLIRRFFRIIPLAWLYLALALTLKGASDESWLAHLLFYANLPPEQVGSITSHIWSLCVEVQFYVVVAFLVAVFGRRGLMLLPILCFAITLYRVFHEVHVNINTYYRGDEILAGCILALVYENRFGEMPRKLLGQANQLLLFVLLLISCHPASGFMNYLRPYLAATLVGATLLNSRTRLASTLDNRILYYIAAISYALYVIHPLLAHSWLGSGSGLEKYIKRPLLFMVLFALAHISTYHYEHRWIRLGKRLAHSRLQRGIA